MTVIYKKYLREATLKKIGLVQLTVLATVWVEHWSCLVKAVDDGIRVEGSCSKAQQQRETGSRLVLHFHVSMKPP